jgi:hypothetical protein
MRTSFGGKLLVTALGFGLLADLLLRATPWGLNLLLVVLLGIAAALSLARSGRVQLEGEGRWLGVAIAFFALTLVWRDSPTLTFANAGALIVATTLAALTSRAGQLRLAGLTQYLLGVVYVLGYAAAGLLPVFLRDVGWRSSGYRWWIAPALATGRGFLVALPPLLIFATLFAAADAQFERFLRQLIDVDAEQFVVRLLLVALYAWVFGGIVREMLLVPDRPRAWTQSPSRLAIGTIELTVVLGLIDLLFLSFVVLQLPYLFGGQTQVTALGYSDYARRGFFELVWVAGLSLPLLLFLHWLIRPRTVNVPGAAPSAEHVFRVLALVMLALLFVVMASAAQRMQLYVVEHGLTELRVQASAFMAWQAVVLVWFASTVLRGQHRRFAFGALVTGFVTVAGLNFLNPDALIVRHNAAIGHLVPDAPSDQRPLASYSADATPAIVDALATLSPDDRRKIEVRLRERWSSATSDWRTFNVSRSQAHAAVASLAQNEAPS